jgi:hypothetical protein
MGGGEMGKRKGGGSGGGRGDEEDGKTGRGRSEWRMEENMQGNEEG